MIVVVGAGGTLGQVVTQRLLDAGQEVRATSRDLSRLAGLEAAGAEARRLDVRDPGSFGAGLIGAETLVVCVHGLLPPSRENDSRLVDLQGVLALIAAAEMAGVSHIVQLSVANARPDHPVDTWRFKSEVEARLAAADVIGTVVAPSAFTETHVCTMLGDPILRGESPQVFGPGTTPRNFVSVEDVADVVVERVLMRPSADLALDVLGPEHLTTLEALDLVAAELGVAVKPKHVPVGAMKLGKVVTARTAPHVSRLMALGIASDAGDDRHDLTPRDGLVIGTRTVHQVVRAWVASHEAPPVVA